jgi:hypothetical protein
MSTAHFKVTNSTKVPVCYAVYEQPKLDNKPSKHGVLKPDETKEWNSGSLLVGNYEVWAVVVGDAQDHTEYTMVDGNKPLFPGEDVMKVFFEDGLQNWLGNLDKADMEAFSDGDLKETLGESFTESVCPTFYWDGMSTHHVQITGGPQLVQEQETGLYRIGKPGEEIEATELLCYRAG